MWRKVGLLLLVLFAAIIWWRWPDQEPRREFVRFRLKNQEYTAVVSRQPAEIQLGLSGRESIGADAMLFLLPQAERATFWMYQMKFPLDFVWLADGKVIDRHENISAPSVGAQSADIRTVQPAAPAEAVLELPAGFIAAHQIQVGDEFMIVGQFFQRVW